MSHLNMERKMLIKKPFKRIKKFTEYCNGKKTDLFKNLFLYKDLIRDAKEIHCINSSFLHLVDRVDTNAKLYYHDVRGGIIKLKKKWKIIYYENKD